MCLYLTRLWHLGWLLLQLFHNSAAKIAFNKVVLLWIWIYREIVEASLMAIYFSVTSEMSKLWYVIIRPIQEPLAPRNMTYRWSSPRLSWPESSQFSLHVLLCGDCWIINWVHLHCVYMELWRLEFTVWTELRSVWSLRVMFSQQRRDRRCRWCCCPPLHLFLIAWSLLLSKGGMMKYSEAAVSAQYASISGMCWWMEDLSYKPCRSHHNDWLQVSNNVYWSVFMVLNNSHLIVCWLH